MPAKSKLFAIVAYAAIVVGFFSAIGGVFGLTYTYNTAAAEKITTPEDARIAEAPVRGPLTMWAQADIVTHHQLERTEGLRYAEMPRQIEQLDEAGNPVIGEDGQPVMVPNQARLSWLDATTIITSLSLGMISYAFSLFALVVGLVFLGMGFVVLKLEKAVAAA